MPRENPHSCGCDGDCDRRDFLSAMGAAVGSLALTSMVADDAVGDTAESNTPGKKKEPAVIRVAFLYPPSTTFSEPPEGWWSWPGNNFDAEGRHRQYVEALKEMAKRLGAKLVIEPKPIANAAGAEQLAKQLETDPTDGLLLVMLYNRSLDAADRLLAVADEQGIPAVFYIGLGVKHGPIAKYRRPGVYFIQSLENMRAIEDGLQMIAARKHLSQSKLLSITEVSEPRIGVEAFLGITVRVTPFEHYAERFHKAVIDQETRTLLAGYKSRATEVRGVTDEAIDNAARAHIALTQLLREQEADGVTMNCLRRGMLKPCMSFATLNSRLTPATCENDLPAAYTQMLGQQLTGRGGFQHNPAFETEANTYYGSHCTCPTRLDGPDDPESPFLLRRFAHTNEGSCAIQVFWREGDPVTMVHYYSGEPASLDVYAGTVVKSHPMPPAGGCTTNVEIALTDRDDACSVAGHHNILFKGDFARKFRHFARLFKMKLADTGHEGPWPG